MAGNKKRGTRRAVPFGERVASLTILALIAGVAVAIGVKGRSYDPKLYSLDVSSLKATLQAPAGVEHGSAEASGSLRGDGPGSAENPAAESVVPKTSQGPAPAAAVGHPLTLPVAELEPSGPTEDYTIDNLYEKIDGQAEGYKNFNFSHMRCRTFTIKGGGGSYLDVYVYDMSKPVNAYGIFSAERDPAAPTVSYASDGYRSAMGIFMRQSKDYLQVMASDAKPATMAVAEKAARALAASIHPDDAGLEGLRALPAGCDPATIAYSPTDAFGIPGLSNAYQADYVVEGKTMTFFVAALPDAKAAAKAYGEFKKYSAQYGKLNEVAAAPGAKSPAQPEGRFDAESFGQWKAIYLRDAVVGGVTISDDRAAADKFVADFLAGSLKLPPFVAKAKPAGAKADASPEGESENPN